MIFVAVLREKTELCSASHIDLPHLEITDTKTSIVLPEAVLNDDVSSDDSEPPDVTTNNAVFDVSDFIVFISVIGTVFILALLAAIFGVMMCIRRDQQTRARIQELQKSEKNNINARPFLNEFKKSVDV